LADFAGAGLRVTVFYYASLREKAGVSSETVTTSMLTVGSLYDELKTRYGFNLDVELLRFAQNDTLVSHDAVLSDNASVVFIPPVSGG
jgi:molybdopterin synthase sulfur carrier subunit